MKPSPIQGIRSATSAGAGTQASSAPNAAAPHGGEGAPRGGGGGAAGLSAPDPPGPGGAGPQPPPVALAARQRRHDTSPVQHSLSPASGFSRPQLRPPRAGMSSKG